MVKLETQYWNYLKDNPDKQLTYEEWFNQWDKLNNLPIHKQTAVEWLIKELENHYVNIDLKNTTAFHLAKEMETRQIIEFTNSYFNDDEDLTAEQYYKKTLKNKIMIDKKYDLNGSDFIKPLKNVPYISDDFQIGTEGAYEHISIDDKGIPMEEPFMFGPSIPTQTMREYNITLNERELDYLIESMEVGYSNALRITQMDSAIGKTTKPEYLDSVNFHKGLMDKLNGLVDKSKYENTQFLRWILKHYSTEMTDDGFVYYKNSMGVETNITDIVEHYNNRYNEGI